MAEFHIRGRVEAIGPASFAAVVVAIPLKEQAPFQKLEDVCTSRGAAVQRLRELTIAMGEKVRAGGGVILDVVTDE